MKLNAKLIEMSYCLKRIQHLQIIIILLAIGCSNSNDSTSEEQKWDCEFVKKVGDSANLYYCKEYYKTGELLREGEYVGSVKINWHKFYRKDGSLQKTIEYVWLDNDSSGTVNQIITFDDKGDTIKQASNYYSINSDNDTITLGDIFKAKIKLETKYWENSQIEFYFDIPHDTSLIRIINTENDYANYDYKPDDTGAFLMSGYFIEFNNEGMDKNKSHQEIEQLIMRFKYDYYVKK